MGSDNLFQKRKARAVSEFGRKKRDIEPKKRYLIICEGTKTEPQYFSEMLADLRIRPQVVKVAPNDGVSPDRVVAHALALYNEDAREGDSYDTVYCVFDRDRHATFESAVQRTKDLKAQNKPFEAIASAPCFEFWLLLHFGYTDAPFHPAGRRSVGDQVVAELRKKPGFDRYGKGQKGIYAKLKGKPLADALSHAAALRVRCKETGSSNPATDVDTLVLELHKLI
jgi:hypothetical protein